jgi:hypothetical protein
VAGLVLMMHARGFDRLEVAVLPEIAVVAELLRLPVVQELTNLKKYEQ